MCGQKSSVMSEDRDDSSNNSLVEDRLPDTNNMIQGQQFKFAVGHKLSPGRYGAVYEVLRKTDGKEFAAKLEVCDMHFHGLHIEWNVLKEAARQRCVHFPSLVDRGKIDGHFKFIVMSKLGENLWKLRLSFVEQRFSPTTALRLAMATLEALEELHSLGYIHRDVKASNFAITERHGEVQVYLLDFGLCRHYRTEDNQMKTPREEVEFRGTTRYASLAAHCGKEQSPKDDIESWLYMVIEMMTGSLPWSVYRKNERDMVKRLKEECRHSEGLYRLLEYCPRMEFHRILKYIDGLKYFNQPDHKFIMQLLQHAFKNNGLKMDDPYDWQED
ncbi:hypothetical protein QR680_006387 [Steinernema hermaphroditum]|uniref:Protein kinase domain-containing protein n=1 Tax=Steinernema hermaphroditum TaxID=289476 RepID=A0AA39HWI6_9BILA|nr:hypothetical protein QR680_006387 [Steinernema hermaphroditum]